MPSFALRRHFNPLLFDLFTHSSTSLRALQKPTARSQHLVVDPHRRISTATRTRPPRFSSGFASIRDSPNMRPLLRSRSRGLQLRDRYNEDSRMTDAKQNQRSYPRLRRMQAFSELALAEAKASTTPTSPLTPTYLQASKNFAKVSVNAVNELSVARFEVRVSMASWKPQ